MSAVGTHVAAATQAMMGQKIHYRQVNSLDVAPIPTTRASARSYLEDFILKAVDLRVLAVDMTAYYLKSTEQGYLPWSRKLASDMALHSRAQHVA